MRSPDVNSAVSEQEWLRSKEPVECRDFAQTIAIAKDKPLWILDPMCGCGGLILGFKQAMPEANVVGIDICLGALKTLHFNLKNQKVHAILADANHLPLADTARFHIVMAGTPCQGFSTTNMARRTSFRAKMNRELSYTFLKIVAQLRPYCFLMENVEGMRSFPDYVEFLQSGFERLGFFVTISILDACDYGVPQYRRRMIWMGSIFESPMPPTPTNVDPCPLCHGRVDHWFYTATPGIIEVFYVCSKCRKIWTRASAMSREKWKK